MRRLRDLHLPHLQLPRHHPLRGLRRESRRAPLNAAVAVAPVVPLLAEPSVRATQVSQLVLGETAAILEMAGDWLRIETVDDSYEGWVHTGYLRELAPADGDEWRRRAAAWSDGAVLSLGGSTIPLPLRARVVLAGDEVQLPDGRSGRIIAGSIRARAVAVADARRLPVEQWATHWFGGSPYQWGGVSPWGVDCSGLVQTAFLARDVSLPRDSSQQSSFGAEVPLDAIQPGDLLFFRSQSGWNISHVAFAAAGDTLVHATIACGGVVHESWLPGARAAPLRERLVAVRRIALPL